MDNKLKLKTKSINTQIKVKTTSPGLTHRLNNIFLNWSILSFLLPGVVVHAFIRLRLWSVFFCLLSYSACVFFFPSFCFFSDLGFCHLVFHVRLFILISSHSSICVTSVWTRATKSACMIDCRNTRVEENMLIIIHNGVGVCSPNVALCASETARFKGLITLAIRFCAAGTVSLSHRAVNIHRHREEGKKGDGVSGQDSEKVKWELRN